MTREEEIKQRLEKFEADRTKTVFTGHVAMDLRYLLGKIERLEKHLASVRETVAEEKAAIKKRADDDMLSGPVYLEILNGYNALARCECVFAEYEESP